MKMKTRIFCSFKHSTPHRIRSDSETDDDEKNVFNIGSRLSYRAQCYFIIIHSFFSVSCFTLDTDSLFFCFITISIITLLLVDAG
jgi:hypothetical protein